MDSGASGGGEVSGPGGDGPDPGPLQAEVGAGRPQGAKDRAPRRRPDARVAEIAAALALAASAETPEPTPGEIGEKYGVGERTAQRMLLAAREQETGEA